MHTHTRIQSDIQSELKIALIYLAQNFYTHDNKFYNKKTQKLH